MWEWMTFAMWECEHGRSECAVPSIRQDVRERHSTQESEMITEISVEYIALSARLEHGTIFV